MQKRWRILQADENKAAILSAQLNISPLLSKLLVLRGIETYKEAEHFFRPSLTHLYNPFLMKDMDKAISRIEAAIKANEKILIYGDYDVDGTTAVALVYTFFSSHYSNIDFYIPDRYKEGYGISTQGIDYAKENNFKLIVALDCGIKANEKIDYANSLGVDFIICDHHLPGDDVPKAIAVLDPKQTDCKYPYKELSGCGIGFKLIQAYSEKLKLPFKDLEQYLDLVAVSIAADIVPLTGENRTLAYYGLKKINASPRIGLKTLFDAAQKKPDEEKSKNKKQLTISDLVFIAGPRINAAGRVASARKAVELLITTSADAAHEWTETINQDNSDRKEFDKQATEQALALIADSELLQKKKTTVVYNPDWHKGVVGIVASRLTEKYYKPTIVLTQSNGMISGSARSVKDFDVYEAINTCADLLEQFGGHKYAAGLTLKPENLEAFAIKFEEVVSATIKDYMLVPEIIIDAEINLDDITDKMMNVLRQFEPSGPGNISPVFMSKNVNDNGWAEIIKDSHLKLNFRTADKNISAIAFGMSDKYNLIMNRKKFSVCYTIEESVFNEKKYLQLNLKDII
jgi:single-stranded-DNA-specific exonuclease